LKGSSPQLYDIFHPKGCSAPTFYGLPKIHKEGVPLSPIMRLFCLCNDFSLYFRYDNQFFSQIMGLPMGTSMPPLLATFYMEYIENSALKSFPLHPRFWGRFVDDVISVWGYGEFSFNAFLVHLNTFDWNLQFILELEENHKLNFLDVLIFKKSPNFQFSIYRKPTDNDRYLHFSPTLSTPLCKKRGGHFLG
jgi:hypothetical protein